MGVRNYSNVAPPLSLTASINNAVTVIPVSGTSGLPAAPFIIVVERGQPAQEVMLATAIGAGTLTVIRGYDNSAATPHDINAPLEHVATAIEYREANAHNNDASQHLRSYVTGDLPATGQVEGQMAYDLTNDWYVYWTGSTWIPVPGTLIGLTEVVDDQTPLDANPAFFPAGFQVSFAMPALPGNRRVRIDLKIRNLWYTPGTNEESLSVGISRNSDNLLLDEIWAIEHGRLSERENQGVILTSFLTNIDLAAGNQTVKVRLYAETGFLGYEAGTDHPATIAATVV